MLVVEIVRKLRQGNDIEMNKLRSRLFVWIHVQPELETQYIMKKWKHLSALTGFKQIFNKCKTIKFWWIWCKNLIHNLFCFPPWVFGCFPPWIRLKSYISKGNRVVMLLRVHQKCRKKLWTTNSNFCHVGSSLNLLLSHQSRN